MDNCLFCKIANKEIPSNKIYEDEFVFAFLDINPATKGHTLVIPKKHYTDIFDMDENISKNIFNSIPKICKALKKSFKPIGLNIVNNNQKPYQVVFHYHIHLIPRYEDDNYEISSIPLSFTSQELEEIQNTITSNL